MLKPECKECPNRTYCNFLAQRKCTFCSSVLKCPDDKKALKGFEKCDKAIIHYRMFTEPCELIEKFIIKNDKIFCMRCGCEAAIVNSYYSSKFKTNEQFFSFGKSDKDVDLSSTSTLECTHCGMRRETMKKRLRKIKAEESKYSVFKQSNRGPS